ncbi:MAG TPA: NADH-quinone oxidoreductase subunit J [Acetobacteraceae bacterium]|nr:NADH-quinone oxidoreductase subunit J [Acetobacteraceae bacterium]
MIILTIAFYVFAVLLLASATAVITVRNPVHSVLFLILAFFNAAGLFLIAGAEFLALILVIVYVGAVAVLFLFVVMMLDIDFAELRGGFQKYLPIGAAVGVLLFLELLFTYHVWQISPQSGVLRAAPTPANISNTAALGRLIYTDYIFLFQAAGLILLVAMIGAIVLTLRERKTSRHQNVDVQHAREVRETMELVQVAIGAGIRETGIYRPKVEEREEPEEADAGGHHAH